jgi:hypothetical protein
MLSGGFRNESYVLDTRNDDRGKDYSVTKRPREYFVDFTVVTGYRECFQVVVGICVIGLAIAGLDRHSNRLANMPTTTAVTAPPLSRIGGSQPSHAGGAVTYGRALERQGPARVDERGLSASGGSPEVPHS